jgi:hypothetical protein
LRIRAHGGHASYFPRRTIDNGSLGGTLKRNCTLWLTLAKHAGSAEIPPSVASYKIQKQQ